MEVAVDFFRQIRVIVQHHGEKEHGIGVFGRDALFGVRVTHQFQIVGGVNETGCADVGDPVLCGDMDPEEPASAADDPGRARVEQDIDLFQQIQDPDLEDAWIGIRRVVAITGIFQVCNEFVGNGGDPAFECSEERIAAFSAEIAVGGDEQDFFLPAAEFVCGGKRGGSTAIDAEIVLGVIHLSSSVLRSVAWFPIPLSCGFVEQDRGSGRHVERVHFSEHGDEYLQISGVHPVIGKSVLLGADHNGNALFHIHIRVIKVCVGCGGEGFDSQFAEPCKGFFAGGFRQRHGEDGTGTGADHVRVEDVRLLVADDDRCCSDGIRTAEDGAQITGFFDRFRHEVKPVRSGRDLIQSFPFHFGDGDQPFRPFPVCDLAQDIGTALVDGGPGIPEGIQQGIIIFSHEHFAAVECFTDGDPGGVGTGQLPVSFQDGHALPVPFPAVPQSKSAFDFRILQTCQFHSFSLLKLQILSFSRVI